MEFSKITVREARAVNAYSPAPWTLTETPDGWVARRGQATLVAEHGRHIRYFKSLDKAIPRLKEEIGVREFKLEAMQ